MKFGLFYICLVLELAAGYNIPVNLLCCGKVYEKRIS
jgi:hypothetical protein